MLLLRGIVDAKHEHRCGHRRKAGIQRREGREGRELNLDGKFGIVEPQRGQRILACHADLLDPGPVGPAAGLQQPRGLASANEEVERHLAVSQGVEELPGGELPIRADLEVARADPSQVHPGIGMRGGIIDPCGRRLEEGFLPPLEVLGLGSRSLADSGRRADEHRPRRADAHQLHELPSRDLAGLRPALARAPALPRHDWFSPASSRCWTKFPII